MKKLIFVDNDDSKSAEKQLNIPKDFLRIGCGLSKDYVDTIEIVGDFWRLSRDEQFELMYKDDVAILTWSVYTPTGLHNSKNQLKVILYTAGSAQIKDKIYIDCSGELLKGLNSLIDLSTTSSSQLKYMLLAINNNYIITYSAWKPVRVVINTGDYSLGLFTTEPIDILPILNQP